MSNPGESSVVKSVFDFEDQEGFNCLIVLFQMAKGYRIENNNEYPSGPMLREIEESFAFLIDLAKKFGLDLNKLLNHTTKHGQTVFYNASIFSEKIMKRLIEEKVKVNSINDMFLTPFFRVR